MNLINFNQVSFKYGKDITALHDVSFPVEQGDFLVIMGPNGSGKTTLMGLMSGVRKPESGEVLFEGESIGNMKRIEIARKIAYVPQHIRIDFPFTVRQVVLMGRFARLKGLGIETTEDIKIAEEAMELTGVMDLSHRMIHQLSGGERQRVFIAQAVASQTSVIMLDEPVSSLDMKYEMQVLSLMEKLNREKGITIITTLHDVNTAARFGNKMLLLKKGRLKAYGDTHKVLTKENIRQVFEVDVEMVIYKEDMAPLVVPLMEDKTITVNSEQLAVNSDK